MCVKNQITHEFFMKITSTVKQKNVSTQLFSVLIDTPIHFQLTSVVCFVYSVSQVISFQQSLSLLQD